MAAEQLDDSSVISRIKAYSNTFKYHQNPKACYSTYILKSKRSVKTKSEPELDSKEVEEGESSDHYKAPKRRKTSTSFSCKDIERKCVICDRARESSGDRNRVLYRISESDRAELFIDALNFYKDEVKTRCVFLDTAGDVFAADVFYHGNCLRQYLLKYNRQIDALFENIQRSDEAATIDLNCKRVFDSLDFKTSSYSVSHIRDLVNANLETDQQIDNRRTKVLLIKCFRDTICFTYQLPQEKRNVKCDAQMTIVDFMALVRKLPIKKMGIDTFGELAESLCNSILATGSESTRIDIIFDVYQKSSIKQMERAQRSSSEQITITIRSDNQKVPVDLDMFWSSMLNKVRLQEYVFKWMLQNVVSEKEIIFGGVNGGECRKLLAGIESEITELSSNQEEADDRIMFHINDVVVKHGVQSVLVDSPDTDVFVNLIFHFHKTWQLQKLFVKLGKRKNKKTVPVHLLVDQLDNNLVSCLPAIHALSGCDSTSKVGPKLSGMKASMDLSLLEGFGVEELSPQMISNAEKFLVSGLKKTDCSTFDEYRWEQYHNAKKELDFNQLVCCSSTLGEHIKRAYLQCKMWLQAPTPAVTTPDPLQYGYKATDVGITPVILPVPCRPDDLPPPCKCPTSCMSTKTCTCRGMNIKCVVFCGCSKGKKCRNPHN